MRRTAAVTMGVLLAVSGCEPGPALPTSPESAARLAGEASNCYTLAFNVVLTPTGQWDFAGVVTGDLSGTVEFSFDPGSLKFAGVTLANNGTATWQITGGVVPVPLNFTTSFSNRNLFPDRPGSDATVIENVGTHRQSSGVERANLAYRGEFRLNPSPRADHTYRGVVCL